MDRTWTPHLRRHAGKERELHLPAPCLTRTQSRKLLRLNKPTQHKHSYLRLTRRTRGHFASVSERPKRKSSV